MLFLLKIDEFASKQCRQFIAGNRRTFDKVILILINQH